MKVLSYVTSDALVLKVVGNIDENSLFRFNVVSHKIDSTTQRSVIFDLSEVNSVPAIFFVKLLSLKAKLNRDRRDLMIRGLSPELEKIVATMKVDSFMSVDPKAVPYRGKFEEIV
jgi:anti-anti-sigma regulatory factor